MPEQQMLIVTVKTMISWPAIFGIANVTALMASHLDTYTVTTNDLSWPAIFALFGIAIISCN